MYNHLKKLLVTIMFLIISVGGVFFVFNNQSDMFNGYTDIIYVEKATIDLKEHLEQIAYDTNSVFAKRIVDVKNNTSGQSINTYVPIGSDKLPNNLPSQTNQSIIEKSSDSTVYIIVKGHISVEELLTQLRSQNNSVRAIQTNYKIVLLMLLFISPQSLMIVFVLFTAFTSLILAEYISQIRVIGIRRLSGEGKHSIAMNQTYQDSLFLLGVVSFNVIGTVIALVILNIFSIQALWIIFTPMIIVFFLLLGINFLLSNVFYYILQNQPIILSVKGKAPMKIVLIIVIFIQLLTLCSVMYSIYGIHYTTNDITLLQKGQREWEKHSDFYQLTSLEDGGTISSKEYKDFYNELNYATDLIYIETNLDNIARTDSPLKYSYFPTADSISNVIYVNSTFILNSPIQVSKDVLNQIKQLNEYDKFILIPKTQDYQYDVLKHVWSKYERHGLVPDDSPYLIDNHPEAIYYTGLYDSSSEIFIYPVFSQLGQYFSNESFVSYPIIIVVKNPEYWRASTVRVNNAQKVINLIKDKKMSNGFGALTNGLYSINSRLQVKYSENIMVIISSIISVFSAMLLFILLNVMYFYQNRKIHFIQRISGKSLFSIHKLYIFSTIVLCLITTICTIILNAPVSVVVTPVIYVIGVFIIFFIQLYREKNANILYLKGE